MYRCEECGAKVRAGQPALVKVTETRPVTYTKEMRVGPNPSQTIEVVVGKGHETAKSVKLCPKCYGIDELPEVKAERPTSTEKEKPENKFTLVLANGQKVTSDRGFELACFLESKGTSVTPRPKKKKGGKSKGARNKTKPAAKKVA